MPLHRPSACIAHHSPRWHRVLLLPALTVFFFSSKSLIKRMAQSVLEVLEDSKGKVQENLLANGGK